MGVKSIVAGFAMAAAAAVATTGTANAALTYVGSWEVDQGPSWYSAPPDGPLAYTGQEAAALLFGGSAADYVISTVDADPADANGMAWYSVIGYVGNQGNGGSILADNYSSKYLGQYYGPTSGYPYEDPNAAASAYVSDNARGSTFINYAFTTGIPEPATWTMMLVGIFGLGAALRARKTAPVLAA